MGVLEIAYKYFTESPKLYRKCQQHSKYILFVYVQINEA